MAAFDPQAYVNKTNGEVTIHEVNDMKRAFDMIDEDKSGSISPEELQGAAVALGIMMEENIMVLLGDRQLTFDEFFDRMTAKLDEKASADDILKIFELYDNDNTGTISAENLINIGQIIGAKESPTEIQEMLNALDTDKDGELCPIDFYTCLVSGTRLRLDEEAKRMQQRTQAQAQQAGVLGSGASSSRLGTGQTRGRLN